MYIDLRCNYSLEEIVLISEQFHSEVKEKAFRAPRYKCRSSSCLHGVHNLDYIGYDNTLILHDLASLGHSPLHL